MKAPNLRRRPPFVRGMPIVLEILDLNAENPMNLQNEKPPRFMRRHLRRLLSEYVRYHHEDRTHLGLEKGTPDGRIHSVASGRVLSQERLGGLHHHYNRAA